MWGNWAKRGGGGTSKAAGGWALSGVNLNWGRDNALDAVQSAYETADSKLTTKYLEAVKNWNEKLANEISSAKQKLQTEKWQANEKIQRNFDAAKAKMKEQTDSLRAKASESLKANNEKAYKSTWDKINKIEDKFWKANSKGY